MLTESKLKKSIQMAADKSEVTVEMDTRADCQKRRNGAVTSEFESKGCDEPLLQQTGKHNRTPVIRSSY